MATWPVDELVLKAIKSRLFRRLLVVAGIIVAVVVGWKLVFSWHSHHVRLTIEVAVDGKVRSASGVVEVGIHKNMQLLPDMRRYDTYVSGDAIFLNLGEGRNVTMVLGFGSEAVSGQWLADEVSRAFGRKLATFADEASPIPSHSEGRCRCSRHGVRHTLLPHRSDGDAEGQAQKVDPQPATSHVSDATITGITPSMSLFSTSFVVEKMDIVTVATLNFFSHDRA